MDDAGSVDSSGGADRSGKGSWIRISVMALDDGRQKVHVRLPIGLVDIGVKMGARYLPNASEDDMEALLRSLHESKMGKVAEVDDLDANERVEIFVE